MLLCCCRLIVFGLTAVSSLCVSSRLLLCCLVRFIVLQMGLGFVENAEKNLHLWMGMCCCGLGVKLFGFGRFWIRMNDMLALGSGSNLDK